LYPKIIKITFALIPMVFSAFLVFGTPDEYEVIKDLRDDWEFYSEKENGYLPYITGNIINTNTIYFHLPLQHYHNKYLIISFRHGSSLWINQRLIEYYPKNKTAWFPIDSLVEKYVQEKLLISVYNPSSTFDSMITVIGVKAPSTFNRDKVNEVFVRETSAIKNSLILISFFIIGLFTILYNTFPLDFKQFTSFSLFFHSYNNMGSVAKSILFSKTQMVFLLGLSSIIAFLLLIHQYVDRIPPLQWFLEGNPVIWSWFLLTIIIFVLLILKYFLIIILSSLFGIQDLANDYFLEIIILSMIFYLTLFIIIVASGLSVYHRTAEILHFLTIPVAFFYPMRLLFIFFRIRKKASVNNLHLFSYLCTTELLPMLIGFKYLFH